MIDILYLAKGREEFADASIAALVENTNWDLARLQIYVDGGPMRRLLRLPEEFDGCLDPRAYGGPVAVMNHHIGYCDCEMFAKIDCDTIVPPGWLDRCLAVMEANPELDLLGIEPPSSTIRISLAGAENGYVPCDSIGGIGLMRRRAFEGRAMMRPHSIYGGFTDWQIAHPAVKKGWLAPSIPLFLLDRLPMDPWASLSRRYIAEGEQRPWKMYGPEDAHLWDWWLKDKQVAA